MNNIKKYLKYLYTLKFVKVLSYILTRKLQVKMHESLKIELEKCNKFLNQLEDKIKVLKNKMQLLNKDIENRKYLTHEYKYAYYYGSQIAIGAINKGLLLLLAGWTLGILSQILVVTLSFILLRGYIGGLHFDSYTKCAWTSLASLVTLGLLSKFMPYNSLTNTIIFATLLGIIFIYAPVEHKNRPLKDNEKIKFKYIAFAVLLAVYSIQTLIQTLMGDTNISNSIMYGVMLSGIIAMPVFKNVG